MFLKEKSFYFDVGTYFWDVEIKSNKHVNNLFFVHGNELQNIIQFKHYTN